MAHFLAQLQNSGLLISGAVFVAAVMLFLLIAAIIMPALETRRRLAETLLGQRIVNRRSLAAQSELTKVAGQRPVEAYFRAVEKERGQNPLEAKLFRAGFHQPWAALAYNFSRLAFVLVGFLA